MKEQNKNKFTQTQSTVAVLETKLAKTTSLPGKILYFG